MSLRGRYIIDRMKSSFLGKYLKFPVPPYDNPNCWEGAYKSLGPNDVNEWANISCSDLLQYSYQLQRFDLFQNANNASQELVLSPSTIATSLGETLGVRPNKGSRDDEPVMILGCGNSKFGEDLLEHHWKGPIVQVDIAARVIESMSQRCAAHIQTGDMLFVQDDANVLSAVQDATVAAVFDKGMVDAIFCTDDYQQCLEIVRSVNRVLVDGGVFCCLSLSRPEFVLQKLLFPSDQQNNHRLMQHNLKVWSDVQIRRLDYIYIYRFTKAVTKRIAQPAYRGRGSNNRRRR